MLINSLKEIFKKKKNLTDLFKKLFDLKVENSQVSNKQFHIFKQLDKKNITYICREYSTCYWLINENRNQRNNIKISY